MNYLAKECYQTKEIYVLGYFKEDEIHARATLVVHLLAMLMVIGLLLVLSGTDFQIKVFTIIYMIYHMAHIIRDI